MLRWPPKRSPKHPKMPRSVPGCPQNASAEPPKPLTSRLKTQSEYIENAFYCPIIAILTPCPAAILSPQQSNLFLAPPPPKDLALPLRSRLALRKAH